MFPLGVWNVARCSVAPVDVVVVVVGVTTAVVVVVEAGWAVTVVVGVLVTLTVVVDEPHPASNKHAPTTPNNRFTARQPTSPGRLTANPRRVGSRYDHDHRPRRATRP